MPLLDGAALLQALGLATLALLAFLACSNALPRWRMHRLPGPRPTWLLGNAGKDRSNSNQLGPPGKSYLALDRWARRFGGCFVMFMGRRPQVVLSDPELVREAGVRRFKAFHDRPMGGLFVGPPADRDFREGGILTAKGRYWSGVRAACERLFHTAALEGYAPAMNQAIGGMVDRLDAAAGSGTGVDVSEALARMTLDVIAATVFGVDLRAQSGNATSTAANPLLEAAHIIFKPFGGVSFLISSLSLGFPALKGPLDWLALRLRERRSSEFCQARALLWGAAQQLLDNARASAVSPDAATNGPAAANGAGTESDRPLDDSAHGRLIENGHLLSPASPTPTGTSSSPNPFASHLGRNGKEGWLGPEVEALQGAAFERGRKACRGAVPPPSSIVHMLRDARNGETGQPLGDVEICAQLVTFLLAGYETTSLTLGYALFELAKQPELQARMAAEVAALGLEPGEELTYAHLQRLPLTLACFNEAMRLYPPVSSLAVMTREAREPASLGGCAVPVGTQVVLIAWSLHHDARLFPEPEAFRPERFLPGSEEAAQRHPTAFIPFGAGPRKCIGYKFALEEGVLALARLVARFEFAPDADHHPPGQPLDLQSGITLTPHCGIWLRVAGRERAA